MLCFKDSLVLNKMQNQCIVILIVILSALLGSCSSKLDRDKAKEMISKKYPEKKNAIIQITVDAKPYYSDRIQQIQQKHEKLVQSGMLSEKISLDSVVWINSETREIANIEYCKRYSASITAEAEKLIVDRSKIQMIAGPIYFEKTQKLTVKIGDLEFIGISGIFDETPGEADIEYNVKFTATGFFFYFDRTYWDSMKNRLLRDPNDLILKDGTTYNLKIKAKKYDDGWRLEEL